MCHDYCRTSITENRQPVLQRTELPSGFQGTFVNSLKIKGCWRAVGRGGREGGGWGGGGGGGGGGAECVISSGTVLWLVGGEVIASQHRRPSGSTGSGVSVRVRL